MPERILLTSAFEIRISNGIAEIDTASNGNTIALAMPLPLAIISCERLNTALDAEKR